MKPRIACKEEFPQTFEMVENLLVLTSKPEKCENSSSKDLMALRDLMLAFEEMRTSSTYVRWVMEVVPFT